MTMSKWRTVRSRVDDTCPAAKLWAAEGRGRAEKGNNPMSFWRAVLCLIFPPLAVLDYGCGTVLIVAALSMVGWVPGVLAALYVNIEHSSKGR